MNKKIISFLSIIILSSTLLIGCSSEEELPEDDNNTKTITTPSNEDNINAAYNLIKEKEQLNVNLIKNNLNELSTIDLNGLVTVELIKDEKGIVFLVNYNKEFLTNYINSGADIFNELIVPNLNITTNLKEELDSHNFTDVDIFFRLQSDGKTYIEIVNKELIILELGNYQVEDNIWKQIIFGESSDSIINQEKNKCKYCESYIDENDDNDSCSKCEQDPTNEADGKHMESTAPYGRCPMCNAANASDKSIQGGYCDECYGQIKAEEYAEKHKYGDCISCGVALTSRQSQSYGGYCPECYGRKYDSNFDSSNMGHCDRCGDDVDLSHTNEGWGYSHLCSACTGELQEQEYSQDDSQVENKTYVCGRCGKYITYTNFAQNIFGYDYICEVCCMELEY